MLLNDSIQIKFKNIATTTVKAGDAVIVGQRTLGKAMLGVVVADVEPMEYGLLETSGIFSFDESDVPKVDLYQQVYAYNAGGANREIKAKFTLTPQNNYIYAGISLTNRAEEGGPLVLALGYNSQIYKAPESPSSPSTSNPSDGGAGAMSDSSTVVDPSSSSEPGAM